MQKIIICLLLYLSIGNLSCKDEIDFLPKLNKDYFIIGLEYSKCYNDCVSYYKLEQNLILVDNTFSYRDKIEFFREPIESSSLALFKYLSENIPASIYRSDSLIGCVHCSDSGVLYIEKFKNGKLHKWQIDTAHENMPLDMKSFTKLAMVVINKLNEDRLYFHSTTQYRIP